MSPWLGRFEHTVDDRFADHVICPGFIDPALHPIMAAVLLPMEFVTAMRWKLPWGTVEPTTTAADFDARMQALHAQKPDGEPLFIWGYHQLWHGDMIAGAHQRGQQRAAPWWCGTARSTSCT